MKSMSLQNRCSWLMRIDIAVLVVCSQSDRMGGKRIRKAAVVGFIACPRPAP